jgi:hypothetical protein
MMNEPIKLTKQLITFSLDSELIKNFKTKVKEENFKYSKVIELLIKNYLKPNIEENYPAKIEEKKEYLNNKLENEEILKIFSNL